MSAARALFAIVLASSLAACGGGAGVTADVRERLASAESRAAHERAPDLIASVETALDEADRAEQRGDRDAAADHATRARLLLDAAQAEAVRIADEEERTRIEAHIAEVLDRARRDEHAREGLGQELARMASIRTAREEALRALAEAEGVESRPPRRGRVSLEAPEDLRRAAAALRARARLTLGAAQALGASEEATRAANEALAASEHARTDPLAALDAADRAHREAMAALGAARRERDEPGPDAALALAEAARAEGFDAMAIPEGTAVEVEGLFSGSGMARNASARVARLAALIGAHPHGPVQVQAQVPAAGRAGEQLARQRAEALRRALVQAGVDASRLTAGPIPSALAAETPVDRARLVFVAYVATR